MAAIERVEGGWGNAASTAVRRDSHMRSNNTAPRGRLTDSCPFPNA